METGAALFHRPSPAFPKSEHQEVVVLEFGDDRPVARGRPFPEVPGVASRVSLEAETTRRTRPALSSVGVLG